MKNKKDELNRELSSYMGSRNKSGSFLLSMLKPRIQISGDVSQESVRKLLESKGIIKNNEQNTKQTEKIETNNTTKADGASEANKEIYNISLEDNKAIQKVNFQNGLNENQSEVESNKLLSSKNEDISKENTKDMFNQAEAQAKTYGLTGKKYSSNEKSIKDGKSDSENAIGSKESGAEEKLSDNALRSSIKKLKRDIDKLLKEKKSIGAKNKYSSDALNLWEITLDLAAHLPESDKSALMKSSTYIDFKKKIVIICF